MKLKLLLLTSLLTTSTVMADRTKVVNMTNLETGESIGTVTMSWSPYGTVFTPDLTGLPAGIHGFHVHQIASCDAKMKDGKLVAGGAAGSHYNPSNSDRHGAPWEVDAHRGVLPALYFDNNQRSTQPVLSPKLSLKELKNRSLMIHAGGDNYSDHPEPLGGGGDRIACGIIN